MLATYETAAREKSIELRTSVDASVPSQLLGDPVAMRQVLTNLVGNAVKFTECGSVALTVTTSERSVDAITLHVEVSDTGIGIAPDVVDRIFNAYTQASYDTAAKFGGSGLGLAITQKLLALYGGGVHVASVPGQGSRFWFNLRLAIPQVRIKKSVRAPPGRAQRISKDDFIEEMSPRGDVRSRGPMSVELHHDDRCIVNKHAARSTRRLVE